MTNLRTEYHQLAVDFYQTVGRVIRNIRETGVNDKGQLIRGELEEEIDRKSKHSEGQMASPRVVLASLVWEKISALPIDSNDPERARFRPVTGFMGSQEHKWFELEFADEFDPLPRKYIVDPAPVGVVATCLLIEPDSPFQLLYKRLS